MQSKKISPTDVIAALLFYFGIERMTSDSTPLHRALFLVRDDPLFRDFSFSTTGTFPLFPDLNLALANLQLTRFLKASGDLEEYYVDETAYSHIKLFILPLFSEDERGSLARHAESLRPTVAAFASEIHGGRIVFRGRESPIDRPNSDRAA